MDRLCEDLVLLAIDSGRGSLGRSYGIGYALMGAELVRLASAGRIDIADGQIIVISAEPTGDAELDAALARIGQSAGPPRPADWVARPRLHICGSYLEQLAAAGVIRPEARRWRTRWHLLNAARLAGARQRLDAIAGSVGEVDLSQTAYAGLACAAGLDRQLYRGRSRRAERARLREVATGRWTVSPGAASTSADTAQARQAVADASVTQAAGTAAVFAAHAATHATIHATIHAVSHAAASAAHGAGAGGGHGGHGGH